MTSLKYLIYIQISNKKLQKNFYLSEFNVPKSKLIATDVLTNTTKINKSSIPGNNIKTLCNKLQQSVYRTVFKHKYPVPLHSFSPAFQLGGDF